MSCKNPHLLLQVTQELGTTTHMRSSERAMKLKVLYDKIIITIVPSYTKAPISLICCRWHCYSCCTLVTIQMAKTCDIFWNSFVLWWYMYMQGVYDINTLSVGRIQLYHIETVNYIILYIMQVLYNFYIRRLYEPIYSTVHPIKYFPKVM